MMLGHDAGLPPKEARPRRASTSRAEGVLFAMATPLEVGASFRWPSWLSPLSPRWDKIRAPNASPSARRSP